MFDTQQNIARSVGKIAASGAGMSVCKTTDMHKNNSCDFRKLSGGDDSQVSSRADAAKRISELSNSESDKDNGERWPNHLGRQQFFAQSIGSPIGWQRRRFLKKNQQKQRTIE